MMNACHGDFFNEKYDECIPQWIFMKYDACMLVISNSVKPFCFDNSKLWFVSSRH